MMEGSVMKLGVDRSVGNRENNKFTSFALIPVLTTYIL